MNVFDQIKDVISTMFNYVTESFEGLGLGLGLEGVEGLGVRPPSQEIY